MLLLLLLLLLLPPSLTHSLRYTASDACTAVHFFLRSSLVRILPRCSALLLAAGADPNARCERDGATALMRNACLGSEAINELLLAARADLDLQDKEGKTALMCAVEFNHSKIALALMGAGAKLDMQSSTGRSALLEVRC
jgi:ankyrin repeat protein